MRQVYSCLFGSTSARGVAHVAHVAVLGLAMLSVACGSNDDDADASRGGQAASPQFLEASAYGDLVTIAPTFPFGVTRKHSVTGGVLAARWGNHDGPVITTSDFAAPASPLKVSRLTLPAEAVGPATRAELTSTLATDLPEERFWTTEGFVDLPFGSLSMVSYSSSPPVFAGELLFYSKDYDRVVSRAHVNGYYGGLGLVDGSTQRIVYTGLSKIASAPLTDSENALWATNICGESVAPTGSCTDSVKLFGWAGNSGPVTADADGNVFVAASLSSGAFTEVVYALTKAQALGSAPARQATALERAGQGTSSLATASKPGSGKGWIVTKGFDFDGPATTYARAYRSSGTEIVSDGEMVENAIAAVSPEASTSFFSDPQGHLWVAVESATASWLLELEPKP